MSKTPRTDIFLASDEMDAGLAAFMGTSRIKAFANFARQLETELADKDRQLVEAKAEIERLKSEHEDSLRRAKNYMVSLSGTVTEQAGELLAKDKQFAEVQAEIERLNKGIKIVQSAFKNYKNADAIIARTTLKKAQILSASCNSDAVDSERAANEILTTEIEHKNALIEQMGRAMEKVIANYRVNLRDLTDFENKQVATLEAALAAKGGE